MTETILDTDDKETEEMMKLRRSIREEMEHDPEPVMKGMMGFLQERRRREKDQQEKAVNEAEKQRERRQEEAAREAEKQQQRRQEEAAREAGKQQQRGQ